MAEVLGLGVGDIVYLRSGSPPLTVVQAGIGHPEIVTVAWFDGNKMCKEEIERRALSKEINPK